MRHLSPWHICFNNYILPIHVTALSTYSLSLLLSSQNYSPPLKSSSNYYLDSPVVVAARAEQEGVEEKVENSNETFTTLCQIIRAPRSFVFNLPAQYNSIRKKGQSFGGDKKAERIFRIRLIKYMDHSS